MNKPYLMNDVVLVPFVCGAGASTLGTERGPVDLEQRDLAAALNARWAVSPSVLYDAPDGAAAHADVPPRGSAARRALVLRACTALRDQVETIVRGGGFPVTLGGDHAMGAGSVAGVARAHNAHGRIGVLWVDAHADINTLETSPSQAYHGMPLAALMGMGDEGFAALGGGDAPVLRPENLFYLGLRDVDAEERALIAAQGIGHLDADAVHDMGYERAVAQAIDHLAQNSDMLFVSIDLDAFDPPFAPSVGTPVAGGLAPEPFLQALSAALRGHHLAGLEVSEYNPALDNAAGVNTTYETLLRCLQVLLPARAQVMAAAL